MSNDQFVIWARPECNNEENWFASEEDKSKELTKTKKYDRDFLLSMQKKNASLRKADFKEENVFKDIVTHNPTFLRPLDQNVNTASDFRDSYVDRQYGGGYGGHGSMGHDGRGGGMGHDNFAPAFLRGKNVGVSHCSSCVSYFPCLFSRAKKPILVGIREFCSESSCR